MNKLLCCNIVNLRIFPKHTDHYKIRTKINSDTSIHSHTIKSCVFIMCSLIDFHFWHRMLKSIMLLALLLLLLLISLFFKEINMLLFCNNSCNKSCNYVCKISTSGTCNNWFHNNWWLEYLNNKMLLLLRINWNLFL